MKTIKSVLSLVLVLSVAFVSYAGEATVHPTAKNFVGFAEKESDTVPIYTPRSEVCILSGGVVGVPYTHFVGALENETGYAITGQYWGIVGKCNYTAEGLPDGLVINAKRGIIHGVPTTAGVYKGTFTATNSHGSIVQKFKISVNDKRYAYYAYYDLLISHVLLPGDVVFYSYGNYGINTYEFTHTLFRGTTLVDDSGNTSISWEKLEPEDYSQKGNDVYNLVIYRIDTKELGFKVGQNSLYGAANNGSGGSERRFFMLNPEDLEGEWDFTGGDTEDPEVVISDGVPAMTFAATKEVTEDTQDVVVDLDVESVEGHEEPTVADILRGTSVQYNYDLYVMLEIGDGTLFVVDTGTDQELTEETKAFSKRLKSGKHRIFGLQMNPLLRMALKGTKVNWYAGCIADNLEVKGQIATATTEFK